MPNYNQGKKLFLGKDKVRNFRPNILVKYRPMAKKILRGIAAFLVIFLGVMMDSSDTKAAQLARHLHKKTLDNGLTLLVKEVPGSKAASVQFWVKAGSVYETADEAGITHLIEHMIFKGTETRGPGELAEVIEAVGGRINAYTSYENTVYHATLSARHWKLALDILCDAVLNSTFDPEELEREKPVVLEEIRMRNDRPSSRLFQELMVNAYKTHPYHLPIIGTSASVSGFDRQDILDYMAKNYHPENFAIVVVGDVRFAEVLGEVEKLLADLPKSGIGRPDFPTESAQAAPRFYHLAEDVNQTNLAMALPISQFDHLDTPVLDVLAYILGQSETSRLYHELRDEKGLVFRIGASAWVPHDPGLFEISAILEAEKVEKTVTMILAELFKLKYLPVSEDELERAKTNLESEFVFNLERVEGQAKVLGTFEFLSGDPREDGYLEQISAVTHKDIMRVANTYFKGNKVTVGVLTPREAEVGLDTDKMPKVIEKAEAIALASVPASLIPNAYLSDVHRFKLDNGIRILVREDHDVPTVGLQVVFPGGLRGENQKINGAFAFISELLPRGTEKMNARELALALGDMAGEISGFNGKNTFGLRADFLSRSFEPGLKLVRDIIRTPTFDGEEAEKIRPELLAHLRQQEDSLPSLAFREFNRILFQGHPYGLNTLGSEEAISSLSVSDLRKIYELHATPEQMVISISGDVDPQEIRDKVEELFWDWDTDTTTPSKEIEEESFLPPEPPLAPSFFNLPRDKEQTHIIVGFLGTTLTSGDRYAVEVMETMLAGQSGRLFTELRDKKSLAYSLSAFSLQGLDTGSFGIYIGTSPEKRDKALEAVWSELEKIRTDLAGDEELQRAKNVLIGHYELSLQTHGSQALEMALNEVYDLGQDFGNRYVVEINKVNAERVREAALKYILPENYIQVIVGATSKIMPEKEIANEK